MESFTTTALGAKIALLLFDGNKVSS
jgi:hypothetical protein